MFDDAFEGAFIGEHEDWFVTKMDVSNDSDKKKYNWKLIAEEDAEKADGKLLNRSSIAVLISYKGIKLLFSGDCAIHFLRTEMDIERELLFVIEYKSSTKTLTKERSSLCLTVYSILNSSASKTLKNWKMNF